MARHLTILIILSLIVVHGFSQSFSGSYKLYCINKINSSIQQRVAMSSDSRNLSGEKIDNWRKQLNERLNQQIKELSKILRGAYKNTGFNFNRADSLTIIYQTNDKSALANFTIISGKHTLKSPDRLALCREINNGGGKLEPLTKDAAMFKVYKTYNNNIHEPFLELALNSDTACAYASDVYCPVDNGNNSIIITAKKANGSYRICDYHLHEFSFVAIPAIK